MYTMRQTASELAVDMTRSGIELVVGRLANITLQSTLLERIKESHRRDPQLKELREKVLARTTYDFFLSETRLLSFQCQICVPMDSEIRHEFLNDAHTTPYSMHLVPQRCIKI